MKVYVLMLVTLWAYAVDGQGFNKKSVDSLVYKSLDDISTELLMKGYKYKKGLQIPIYIGESLYFEKSKSESEYDAVVITPNSKGPAQISIFSNSPGNFLALKKECANDKSYKIKREGYKNGSIYIEFCNGRNGYLFIQGEDIDYGTVYSVTHSPDLGTCAITTSSDNYD